MGIGITITIVVLAVVIVFFVLKGVCIVPEGERWVVQRLGKYSKTLDPGLNYIVPFMESIVRELSTKDIVMDIPPQEVITRDNVLITANAVAYIKIVRPSDAIYGIEDYEVGIRNLVQTSLRSIIGNMGFDDALSSREQIKNELKVAISDDISDWGITLKTVEIQDISPTDSMQVAMEEESAAERQRRAIVIRAEGQKKSAVLEAEGRLQASKLDAQSQVILAKGSEQSIKLISDAMGNEEMPVVYLLGEQYIKSMQGLAESENAKTVVLPADILNTVKGLAGDRLHKRL